MFFILLIILIAAVDLTIKGEIEAADAALFPQPAPGSGGKIILHQSHNPGFPFGFLKDRPEVVKLIPVVVISGLFGILGFLLPKKGFILEKLGVSLVLGGALSNLYDRMKRNYVVDYFSIDLQGIKKVIFNLGDFFIFAGAAVMAAAEFYREIKSGRSGK